MSYYIFLRGFQGLVEFWQRYPLALLSSKTERSGNSLESACSCGYKIDIRRKQETIVIIKNIDMYQQLRQREHQINNVMHLSNIHSSFNAIPTGE